MRGCTAQEVSTPGCYRHSDGTHPILIGKEPLSADEITIARRPMLNILRH